MKKFNIRMAEVHYQEVEIEAEDWLDAVDRVMEGDGTYLDNSLEFSHTLDVDKWKIEEV